MKTLEEIKKEIQELQFAINPTETRGILWKWNKHGLDILSFYVESTILQTKQELIEEIKVREKIVQNEIILLAQNMSSPDGYVNVSKLKKAIRTPFKDPTDIIVKKLRKIVLERKK